LSFIIIMVSKGGTSTFSISGIKEIKK
jgi:hypothetical protein